MAKNIEINIQTKGTNEIENASNAYSDLIKEIKKTKGELTNLDVGSEAWKKASKDLSELKEKLDDVQDATKAASGNGVERLHKSFGMMTEAFQTADFGKAKLAFQNLAATMKAVPIFLLIEGVRLLIENFDKISALFDDSAKRLAKLNVEMEYLNKNISKQNLEINSRLSLMKDVAKDNETELEQLKQKGASLDVIKIKLNAINEQNKTNKKTEIELLESEKKTNAERIKILNAKLFGEKDDAKRKEIEDELSKINEFNIQYPYRLAQLNLQLAGIEREVKQRILNEENEFNKIKSDAAKAAHDKEEKDLLTLKQLQINNETDERKRIVEQRDFEISQITAKGQTKIKITEELNKKYDLILALHDEEVLEKQQKNLEDEAKRKEDARKKELEEEAAFHLKMNQQRINDAKADVELSDVGTEKIAAQMQLIEVKRQIELENSELTEKQKLAIFQKYENQKTNLIKQYEKQKSDAAINTGISALSAVSSFNDLIQTQKLSKLKKGSEAEMREQKRQFESNKALQISMAGIQGIQGVINALTAVSVIPEPLGSIQKGISAAAVGAATAANIAKIKAAQFNGGGSDVSVDVGDVSPSPTSNYSMRNITSPVIDSTATLFETNAKQSDSYAVGESRAASGAMVVKAYVVADELTTQQQAAKMLKDKTTY